MDTKCSAHIIGLIALCHVLDIAHAGSYLTLGINECFERVSIGKRLNESDVTKTVSTSNLVQCSIECERNLCNAYSFGLTINGNGTCLLAADLPKSGLYDDPEYDLFMKILQCRDRTMCFTKLVGGRRLTDKYVQRTLPVESKRDCEMFCEYEKEFRCEGFNYRYDTKLSSYSSCQLTAVPTAKLDLSLDFFSDVDYDFYEKNVNVSPICRYLDLAGPVSYGQNRKWGFGGNDQELTLWRDPNPTWIQRNDVGGGYGNDPVYYDRGSVSPTLGGPNINPFNNFNPTMSPGPDRQPTSPFECFIKARTGHHLQRNNIIKSLNAQSLYNCETICASEQTFVCNLFSYRYSFTSSMDNCHLGDKFIRQLDIYQDLVPDRDSDVFVRNELSQPGCQPRRNWDTDCFERIRSGLTIQIAIIKFSVQAENLHECELMCLHIKHFTCRVFSFRRTSAVIGKWADNCFLTDYPVMDMDPTKHFIEDAGCDIYNRGSFGRGCELDKTLPGLWPTSSPPILTTYRPTYGQLPPQGPPQFVPGYGPPLDSGYGPPNFPIGPTVPPPFSPTTPTMFTPTKPTGTYVPSQPPTTFFQMPNEYTPVSGRPQDRQPYPDISIGGSGGGGGGGNPYGQNPQVPQFYGPVTKLCYISFGGTARLLPPAIRKSMTVDSEMQCKMECNNAREKSYFRCSTLSYFGGYCDMSDIEMRDLRPNQDFSEDQRFLLFTWDFNEIQCYVSPVGKLPRPGAQPGVNEWTWMRFTVNGQPCKSGSYCTQNAVMGIWSCPVDQGGWDYCCRPDHRCGYSEGISYPWCYVGKTTEQWRPCSDQYYPSADHPVSWPVNYIHNTGPPIGNDASLARSNDTTLPAASKSIVDQFLSIFTSDDGKTTNLTEQANSSITADKTSASLTAASDVPAFQVVDVTDSKATKSETIRLYSYGDRNSASGLLKRRPYV
ncbi:uncharacterized protein LOC126837103 [Adelges cooleyi]|uniref:uncharacterized protein LOC126837103 n=1 Tax=Adelges cooleyi TaxID=133065 RepID=UPI00217FF3C5|nr:uncharacterized protein LOC126837103 [Adelges cooleyi]